MGYIGKDRSGSDSAASWFPTAPTEPDPPQEDKTSIHDIYWSPEGIACCTGVEGES